ncbi:WD repeat-containing protein 81-like [Amphibalanus amphitrite]|uniref:WD repeat-containing protein 81-like n=1 Tax=Amphibalanus amphitrite TaxID=1232801 RepID=UPI001C91D83E|nr:WD repeat-containing protein 81-like [Amphibalanus amphitrite]
MTILNCFEELNIPSSYWCQTGDEDCVLLTTKIWRRELRAKHALPSWFPLHKELSSDEVQYAVREHCPPDTSWTLLNLWSIPKPGEHLVCLPEPSSDGTEAAGTYAVLLRQVARDNFCNSWRRVATKYPDVYPEEAERRPPVAMVTADAALRELLRRVFGLRPAPVGGNGGLHSPTAEQGDDQRPVGGGGVSRQPVIDVAADGLQPALAVLELRRSFVVVSDRSEFTLRHLADFSPGQLTENSRKAVFVGYQLLRALAELRRRGVPAGDLRLSDVWVDSTLWLRVRPRLAGALCSLPAAERAAEQEGRVAEQAERGTERDWEWCDGEKMESEENLSFLTQAWSCRRLSNLGYLLALNRLSGRRFEDPAYHPVVPWVSDLTGRRGGWRDLSRSKYRLNKGDEQLDLQYKAGASADDQVAHHISDMLSEITYYVYMARRTPQSVLCKHVRAQWVPGEYPTSLVRLQAWTPDECIPQFYTDPEIVKSIHPDMADLELPEWADSPASFIAGHRAALESDHVSAQLHHWIDLTFGYKLTGMAAVRAKNVCRHLAESSDTLRRQGVLQLFAVPHPPRQMALPLFSRLPPAEDEFNSPGCDPEASRAAVSDNDRDSADPEEASFVHVPTSSVIRLPAGYQPAAALHRLEALGAFVGAVRGRLVTERRESGGAVEEALEARRHRDIYAWLCLMAELCSPAAFRSLSDSAPLESRLQAARQALASPAVPACLSGLLPLVTAAAAAAAAARPPPTVAALLTPSLSPLPLPPHVEALYAALAEFGSCAERQREVEEEVGATGTEAAAAAELWVRRFSARLGPLLSQLSDAEMQLLVPPVTRLLTARATSVLAAWHVFSVVAARLGPAAAREVFLQPLLRMYRRDAMTCKSMKLFHRSFLLHLAVRLGHDAFIAHFIAPLIEAAGGCRPLTTRL